MKLISIAFCLTLAGANITAYENSHQEQKRIEKIFLSAVVAADNHKATYNGAIKHPHKMLYPMGLLFMDND